MVKRGKILEFWEKLKYWQIGILAGFILGVLISIRYLIMWLTYGGLSPIEIVNGVLLYGILPYTLIGLIIGISVGFIINKKIKNFEYIGGLIGFVVGILIFIIPGFSLFLVFFSLLIQKIIKCTGGCWEALLLSIVLTPVLFCIIGGLIGHIIRKIKTEKNEIKP